MPRRSCPAEPPGAEDRARSLLSWYREHRRPLPWRTVRRDPYRTWVAEVLLQQTRVEQAVPYFRRFVARFPDLPALARAPPAEVLKVWQGAGYYGRARRLHAAAREIVAHHGGRLPSSPEELERLPGVGPYTARAVAAIAFGVPVVPVDANAVRVAARWVREERDVGRAAVRAALVAELQQAVPVDDPGGYAEALMELGETVCRPQAPRCEACPVALGCRAARELSDPGAIPRRPPRPTRPHVRAAVVALAQGDRWLVQRRPSSGFLGGLWEFPGGKVEDGEAPEAAARRELKEETGLAAGRLRQVGVVRHGYSHFSVELHVFLGRARRRAGSGPRRRWATLDQIARLPLPRATEKIVRALRAEPLETARTRGPPGPAGGPTRSVSRPE